MQSEVPVAGDVVEAITNDTAQSRRAAAIALHVAGALVIFVMMRKAGDLLHLLAVSTNRGDGPDAEQMRNAKLGILAICMAFAIVGAIIGIIARRIHAKAWVWFAIAGVCCCIGLVGGLNAVPNDLRPFGSECRPSESYYECH